MKDLTIKYGTKKEILNYLRTKTKEIPTNWPYRFPPEGTEGTRYEDTNFEEQINAAIDSGSPFVAIRMKEVYNCGTEPSHLAMKTTRELFLIEDYSDLKVDMEMARLDDTERRDRIMKSLRMVMDMELDAQERWNRIMKVFEEFKEKTIRL